MRGKLLFLAVAGLIGASFVACGDEGGHHHGTIGTVPTTTATGGGDGGAPPSTPMLVDVDANKTLSANGGDGVGVFTEYKTGGHWHIWWTCDTNATNQPCAFDIKVSIPSGAISKAVSDAPVGATSPGATVTTPTASSVEATSTTTTSLDGITFDAPLGSIITLDASISGTRDGSFLFFVQGGKVNGGFTGKLTDPLNLEAATP